MIIALKVTIGLLLLYAGLRMFSGALKTLGKPEILVVIDNPWAMAGVALVVTILIQSSSLTSVLILAVAASGHLTLASAIGGLVGANIGTTATAWLAAGLLGMEATARQLALVHTLMNLLMLGALPFARQIANLVVRF